MTNLDIDETVKQYFKSLKGIKSLTKAEEHRLLRKYKMEGDLKARDKVIESNLKYTCKIANNYRGKDFDFSFLISEANDALIEAIDKFDIRRDVKIMSYAKWWIMQRLQSVIDKKNKMPTGELPEENDVSEDMCDENEIYTSSIDYFSKYDNFANEMDEEYDTESQHKFICSITNCLNGREKDMIALYYGLIDGKEYTLEDIGKKYGITKERARQIIETGFRKIRSKSILMDSQYIAR